MGAVELFAVVHHDHLRNTVNLPFVFDLRVLSMHVLLRQDGMAQAVHDGEVTRRVEANVKTRHHSGVDIKGGRQPWSTDGQAFLRIDDEEVEFRVIYFHSFEWASWSGRSLMGAELLVGTLTPISSFSLLVGVELGDDIVDAPEMREWQLIPLLSETIIMRDARDDRVVDRWHGGAFPRQVYFSDDLIDDADDFSGYLARPVTACSLRWHERKDALSG